MTALLHPPAPPPSLAADFPSATEADWRKLVDGVLKGVPFEKKLVARSADSIVIPVLSPRKRGAAPIVGARGVMPWGIVARLDHPDAATANALAREELEGGADQLVLTFAGSPAARGFGLPDTSKATLDAAFEGIFADLVSLNLETGAQGAAEALALGRWLKDARYVPAALRVAFGLDPAGMIARDPGRDVAEIAAEVGGAVRALAAMGFAGPFLSADARLVHEAGASEAQELGYLAASAVTGLRLLADAGLTMDAARNAIGFVLVADQDQLLTIAKFRAFRLIWARIEAECGLEARPATIRAETAWRMMTRRDVHVNILRATLAAFSAGLGGADSIGVLPHTLPLGLPDGAARRLARNTSHILLQESNLHRVLDPACGAGGIEALTADLAEAGWQNFQQLEASRLGALAGLPAAIRNGALAGSIAGIAAARARDIATRRLPITGTSEFPNLAEAKVDVLLPARQHTVPGPFASRRLAEPFETLRDRAEALEHAGRKPRVFLAGLGPLAAFAARAGFARGIFEAGGIEAPGNDGFTEGEGTDLVAMTDAFKASGAALACICSTDALYAEEAGDAAMALMASGAAGIFLAGRPAALEQALRAAGVGAFIFAGCDSLALLANALDLCEAPDSGEVPA